jgi:hypothetical protein
MARLGGLMIVLSLLAGQVFGGDKNLKNTSSSTLSSTPWVKHYRQGYSMRIWLSNQMLMGEESWEPYSVPSDGCGSNQGIGLEYPVGSCIEHLFAGEPWVGGIINGVPVVSTASSLDQPTLMEFLPEKTDTLRDKFWHTHTGLENYDSNGYSGYYYIHGIQVNRRGCDDDGDGKIDEDELDGQDNDGDWNPLTDDIGADGIPDSLETGCDGKRYDPVTNPDPAYDDYDPNSLDKCHLDSQGNYPLKNDKNKYTEKNGIPDHGEPHVDEDYGALSDNDIYYAATDTFKSYTVPGHVPMGIKLFVKSYAWQGDFANGILPFDFYFINIGKDTISNVYFGLYCDMDVGPVNFRNYYGDNYACSFQELLTGYVANAVDHPSSSMGLTLLGASRPLDSLTYNFITSDIYQPSNNDNGLYQLLTERYLTQVCTSPSAPTDIRFLFSIGPFGTMYPGDTARVTAAFVGGSTVNDGPDNLRHNVEQAIAFYHNGLKPPPVLPSPALRVTQKDTKVTITWGHQVDPSKPNPLDVWDESNKLAEGFPDTSWRRTNPPCGITTASCPSTHVCRIDKDGHLSLPGGRIFEGFRLYRSEDQGSIPNANNWTLIKQYDVPGDIYGYNVGLDSIYIDSNLTVDKRYWYSVTSFSIPEAAIVPLRNASGVGYMDTIYGVSSESPISENQTSLKLAFSPSEKLGRVLVVPNPCRTDRDYTTGTYGWEDPAITLAGSNRVVKFIHLPAQCTIHIMTLVGEVVATLSHNDPVHGELNFNLFSEAGHPLASGVYIFTVDSNYGRQIGKFVVIR